MNWQTQEEREKAAKGSMLDAARCSLEKWEQFRDASYSEIRKHLDGDIALDWLGCALCLKHATRRTAAVTKMDCEACPIPSCGIGGSAWQRSGDARQLPSR